MAFGALGTDTGGSCRIPAAMCGIVGYKPTARRVPIAGVLPLAPSLDSIGPLANSVACCATLDAVLADEPLPTIPAMPVNGLRLGVPRNVVFDGMDETVATAFDRAVSRLSAAGVRIEHLVFPPMDEIAPATATGGLAAPEAYAWHRRLLAEHGEGYDPMVRKRILRGEKMSLPDYLDLVAARAAICRRMNALTARFDALLMPTCPLIPPPVAALEADDAEYTRVNTLQLRNTTVGNFLDRCAISLPCHAPGEAPVGLMLMGETMGDARLFAVAAAVEAALR
jgi:aspartyl-tRNA(Asn)/glutamyl-tRNA(Gln) amidotransferase subunit A